MGRKRKIEDLSLEGRWIFLSWGIGWLGAFAVIFYSQEWIWLDWGLVSSSWEKGREGWYVLRLTDSLGLGLRIGSLGACLCSFPLGWFLLYSFWARGLTNSEGRIFSYLLISSSLFLLVALIIGEKGLIPRMWVFFLTVENGSIHYLPSLDHYFQLYMQTMLVLVIVGQIPLAFWLLRYWKWVSWRGVAGGQNRAWIWVGSLGVATILSPPDLVSQLVFCGPFWVGYEGLVWWFLLQRILQNSSPKKQGKSECESQKNLVP